MIKCSPEVKLIADKYCDEQGGPPKKREELMPRAEMDFGRAEGQIISWLDEASEFPPHI